MKRALLSLILCFTLHIASGEGWRADTEITNAEIASYGIVNLFAAEPISDSLFARMRGKSYKENCTIPRSELCYIKALHITLDGKIKRGEMVVNRAISDDILYILRKLFEAGYPIERMVLVDNYNADDEASMTANNSSAFNYRTTPGGTKLSAHSRGMAVDINPLYNPYVKVKDGKTTVAPEAGRDFVERSGAFPYKIDRDDLCCQLFLERGFEWGGDYKSIKDYQHFEK
jgi:hypothetical protein